MCSSACRRLLVVMIVGKGSAGFETIVALVDRLPAMILPRWAKTPTQPIALDDVVRYLAGVCGNEAAFGETYDVGGPDVLSYAEMISRIGRMKGKAPYLVEVPVLTPWLSALWIELVTPARASVARPLVEGMSSRMARLRERRARSTSACLASGSPSGSRGTRAAETRR